MTLTKEEAPANFVPAAAVIRKVLALFKLIGRKEFVGCILLYVLCKKPGLSLGNAFITNILEYN